MYVRRRKNVSGSTSVFIVDSIRIKGQVYAKSIMAKSFGSSSDHDKIDAMVLEAKEWIAQNKEIKKQNIVSQALNIESSSDIDLCNVERVGVGELYGSIFNKFFGSLVLRRVNKKLLEEIAIMRLACPTSKLKTAAMAESFGIKGMTPNKIYRMMDHLNDKNIKNLKNAVYENSKSILGEKENVDVLFYDLTTIYFETNNNDTLKDFGFSKDGKHQHVQITMALIVTKHGLPISYELFPGNIYEGHTLIPVLTRLRQEYKIDKVSVVADSALMNNINLTDLEANSFGYIVAARVRNLSRATTNEMLRLEDYTEHTENSDIRYRIIKLKEEEREEGKEEKGKKKGRFLITAYSGERARKDAYDRARLIEKASKYIGSSPKGKLSGGLKKPYFTLSKNCEIVLDEAKIAEAAKMDGYFGFYTNLNDKKPEEILAQYKGLWQVEQTFRISKHNLKIRPVYHWNEERIKAHFAICFLALSLARFTEVLLKRAGCYVPMEQLGGILENVYCIMITSNGRRYRIRSSMSKEAKLIYNALGIKSSTIFSKEV
jgi:transposase